ncbi:hypothetical protein LEP1GSC198_2954 [Leptospira kirschneri str. JB]|nr:hypothetical protein LEP1GSC198_2954 [Leptospira kirschneri str. JB]
MFYGDFVSNFFSLDSILFALFDILTLFQGRLFMRPSSKMWDLTQKTKGFKLDIIFASF